MVTAVAEFIQAYYGTVFTVLTALGGLIWWLYGLQLKEPNSADFKKFRNRVAVQSGGESLYVRSLADLLNWADHFYEGGFREKRPNPWSSNAYGMSLILALVYPITAAVISWGFTGQAGRLGQALGLTLTSNALLHGVTFVWMLGNVAITMYVMKIYFKGGMFWRVIFYGGLAWFSLVFGANLIENIAGERLPVFVDAFALAVIVAIAGAGVIVGAFADAGAGAIAIAFVVTVVGAGAVPLIFVGALIVVFVSFIVVVVVVAARKYPSFVFVVSIMYLAASFVFVWVFPEIAGDHRTTGLMIGLLLLPLVNAPFDFFSTGLTRCLLRKSYSADGWKRKSLLSLVDLAVALFAMVLLGLALVVVLELFNTAASATVVDVAKLLASIKTNPTAIGNWWIYAALFSTLLPTLIHVVCWALSFIRFTLPRGYRDWMVAQFDDCFADGPMTKFKVQASLALQMWLAIAFTGLAFVGFFALIVGLLHGGKYYLEILMYVQQVVSGWL